MISNTSEKKLFSCSVNTSKDCMIGSTEKILFVKDKETGLHKCITCVKYDMNEWRKNYYHTKTKLLTPPKKRGRPVGSKNKV